MVALYRTHLLYAIQVSDRLLTPSQGANPASAFLRHCLGLFPLLFWDSLVASGNIPVYRPILWSTESLGFV